TEEFYFHHRGTETQRKLGEAAFMRKPEAAMPPCIFSGSFPPQQPQRRRLLGTPVLATPATAKAALAGDPRSSHPSNHKGGACWEPRSFDSRACQQADNSRRSG